MFTAASSSTHNGVESLEVIRSFKKSKKKKKKENKKSIKCQTQWDIPEGLC